MRNNARLRLDQQISDSDEIDSDLDTDGAPQSLDQTFSQSSDDDEDGSSALNMEKEDDTENKDSDKETNASNDQSYTLASFLKSSATESLDRKSESNCEPSTSTVSCSKDINSHLKDTPNSLNNSSINEAKPFELNAMSSSIPVPIKSSYSTSYDTSETSGFGSLMEDSHPPSNPHSFEDNMSDNSSSGTQDKEVNEKEFSDSPTSSTKRKIKAPMSSSTNVSNENEHLDIHPPSIPDSFEYQMSEDSSSEIETSDKESNENKLHDVDSQSTSIPNSSYCPVSDHSSSENETTDQEVNENKDLLSSLLKRKINVPRSKLHMDTKSTRRSDEKINADQAVKHRKSSNEDSMDTSEEDLDADVQTNHSTPQLFSIFLKEKVDTLPIPSSLKAYILHYR